jgi:hypothetical protein
MWRDGAKLVIRRGEQFPDRCVKTNHPAHGRRKQHTVSWADPLAIVAFLPLLFVPFLGDILCHFLMMGAEDETLSVGLSEEWSRKRIAVILGTVWVVIASLMFILLGLANLPGLEPWLLIGFGALLLIVALVFCVKVSTLLVATRITEHYLWLRGAHPDFLAGLPEWPGETADQMARDETG